MPSRNHHPRGPRPCSPARSKLLERGPQHSDNGGLGKSAPAPRRERQPHQLPGTEVSTVNVATSPSPSACPSRPTEFAKYGAACGLTWTDYCTNQTWSVSEPRRKLTLLVPRMLALQARGLTRSKPRLPPAPPLPLPRDLLQHRDQDTGGPWRVPPPLALETSQWGCPQHPPRTRRTTLLPGVHRPRRCGEYN